MAKQSEEDSAEQDEAEEEERHVLGGDVDGESKRPLPQNGIAAREAKERATQQAAAPPDFAAAIAARMLALQQRTSNFRVLPSNANGSLGVSQYPKLGSNGPQLSGPRLNGQAPPQTPKQGPQRAPQHTENDLASPRNGTCNRAGEPDS